MIDFYFVVSWLTFESCGWVSLNHCSCVSGAMCARSGERSVSQGSTDHNNILLLTYIWPVQRICKSPFMHKRDQIRNVICTRNKNGIQVTHFLSTEKRKNWHLEESTVNTVWTRIESVCTMLAVNQLFHLLLLKDLSFKCWKDLSIFLRGFVILLLTFKTMKMFIIRWTVSERYCKMISLRNVNLKRLLLKLLVGVGQSLTLDQVSDFE